MDEFPGLAVEGVTDSSRYFVLRIEDGNGKDAREVSSVLTHTSTKPHGSFLGIGTVYSLFWVADCG